MDHFQSLITHSEKGLVLDMFGEKSIVLKASAFVMQKNTILYYTTIDKKVVFYDYQAKKELISYEMDTMKQISLTEDAELAAVLDLNKRLFIYTDNYTKISMIDNVCKFVATENCVSVFDINQKMFVYLNGNYSEPVKIIEMVSDFLGFGNNIFYYTRKSIKDGPQSLFHLINGEKMKEITFPNIISMNVKSNKTKDKFLLLINTEYLTNSYFGMSKLFYYSKNDELKYKMDVVPATDPILSYDFIDNNIAVCYDKQPSSFSIFSEKLVVIKTFPKCIRNQFYFNPHHNLVSFAGFNNLSGNVDVYKNDKLLAQLKVLGASKILWSNNGSYFCVCVTNKLKVDNKIIFYDYFGREIKKIHFENLIDVEFGNKLKSEFVVLEEPKKLNVIEESFYVPPNLRNQQNKKNDYKKYNSSKLNLDENKGYKKDNQKYNSNKGNLDENKGYKKNNQKYNKSDDKDKNINNTLQRNQTENIKKQGMGTKIHNNFNIKQKIESAQENLEDLQKKLKNIEILKKRISKGELLQMDEINIVLAEDEVIEKIKKMK